MARIAQLIVLSDKQRAVIRRMWVMASGTVERNPTDRMMAYFQEIILDAGVTQVAQARL